MFKTPKLEHTHWLIPEIVKMLMRAEMIIVMFSSLSIRQRNAGWLVDIVVCHAALKLKQELLSFKITLPVSQETCATIIHPCACMCVCVSVLHNSSHGYNTIFIPFELI